MVLSIIEAGHPESNRAAARFVDTVTWMHHECHGCVHLVGSASSCENSRLLGNNHWILFRYIPMTRAQWQAPSWSSSLSPFHPAALLFLADVLLPCCSHDPFEHEMPQSVQRCLCRSTQCVAHTCNCALWAWKAPLAMELRQATCLLVYWFFWDAVLPDSQGIGRSHRQSPSTCN